MAWMQSVLWPFIRIASLFSIAPLFGAQTLPVRVRISGALAISLLIAPSLSS
ncbi:MAG: flagellar biosynthetic protein FliR, partial [Gammaproteobacteria bacterium]|nr:flagellar biosynthetic protein FliR [Gammaproteobacteria bacterium]